MRLSERRVLITGGAGGLGSAVAKAILGEGATLVVLGRTETALAALCDELGSSAHAVCADVSDPKAASDAVEQAVATLGGLDTLINAAAIDIDWAPVGEMAIQTWDKTIAINLSGTFYVCRAALPHLVAAGQSAIVNFTSVAAYKVWPEDAAYNVSKAGVDMLTRTIAIEYGSKGVRANCVSPSVIDAGMTSGITDQGERDALAKMHAIPRWGRAEEVAEAVIWLASAESSFTTGSTLPVDGGFLDR